MTDEKLVPVDRASLADALFYALKFRKSGKPHLHAHELTAQIVAEMLAEHLEMSGWVVMRPLRSPLPSTAQAAGTIGDPESVQTTRLFRVAAGGRLKQSWIIVAHVAQCGGRPPKAALGGLGDGAGRRRPLRL